MYEKGDVYIVTPRKGDDCEIYGGRCGCGEFHSYKDRDAGLVCLPHSCDEWEIGNKAQVEQLIIDLQELIK